MKRIAFAGGGSGGHCYPLLSIAKKLKEKYPSVEIYFITKKNSIESKIIGKTKYPSHYILSGKLNTSSWTEKILTLCKIPIAIIQSISIIIKKRPCLVLSSGAHAGSSFAFTAFLMKVPCVIYEQNRKPGIANTLMSIFAKKILLNFSSTKEFFKRKNIEVVGMATREEIQKLREIKNISNYKIFSILVIGGSQGSVNINKILINSLKQLKDIFPHIRIIHQSGENNYKSLVSAYKAFKTLSYKVVPYIENISEAYEKSHLVICRAGASTLAELISAKKASILIPLSSKDKHQIYNARELHSKGRAELVYEEDAQHTLSHIIRSFYKNRNKLVEMEEKIGSLYKNNVEENIISILEELR